MIKLPTDADYLLMALFSLLVLTYIKPGAGHVTQHLHHFVLCSDNPYIDNIENKSGAVL